MKKKGTSLRLLAVVALAGLLAAGCAKKPAPSAAATAEQTPVSSTTMEGQQVPGVQEQAVTEAPAAVPAAQQSLQMVHFAFNEYTLSPEARDILVQNAAWMKAHPEAKVRVEGNCDERGSEEYNLALGQKRADAAEDYLEKEGVAADRLTPHGYGKTNFVASNRTKEGRAQNRRVELVPAQ